MEKMKNNELENVFGGNITVTGACVGCGHCVEVCPAGAISVGYDAIINVEECTLCGSCAYDCAAGAIIID